MSELREYVVTLYQHQDLDEFYQDMETPGGSLYIPHRLVEVFNRRPTSRNTHYLLSDQEAELLRQDSRVRAVTLSDNETGSKPVPAWSEVSGYFSKDVVTTANDINWGLLRAAERDHVGPWGSDVTEKVKISDINSRVNGANVDFVIAGYTVDAAAPEFAVNADGTGGSRYFYVNWGSYGLGSTYTQAAKVNSQDGEHETMVASIALGNTQGWARKARFTQIPADTAYYDYVRAWHTAKTSNPNTGLKNPTIVIDAYGYNFGATPANISTITYRGTVVNGPFTTSSNFSQYKLWLNNTGDTLYGQANNTVVWSEYNAAKNSDIEDLINDGVIFVGISHNWRGYHDVPGGPDYNNTIQLSNGNTYYYNRGFYSSALGAIQVGAISDLDTNVISPRSGKGPRITIWAPSRTSAISHWGGLNQDGTGLGYNGGIQTNPASQGYLPSIKNTRDPRNNNYFKVKTSDGSSFAGPQVAGVIGLLAELSPDLTPALALSYINFYADSTGVSTSGLSSSTANALAFYAPSFSITPDKTSLLGGETITFVVTTQNVADGARIYLKDVGSNPENSDFVDGVTQGVVIINGDTASFVRTLSPSFSGEKVSFLELRTGGYNGTLHVTSDPVILAYNPAPPPLPVYTTSTTGTVILAENYNAVQIVAQDILGTDDNGYGSGFINSIPVGTSNLAYRDDYNALLKDLNNIHIHIYNTSTSTLSFITNPTTLITVESIDKLKNLAEYVLPNRYVVHPEQYHKDSTTGLMTNFDTTSTRTLSWGTSTYSIIHDSKVWFSDRRTARYFFNIGSYLTCQVFHNNNVSGGVNDEWKSMIAFVSNDLNSNPIKYDREKFLSQRPGSIIQLRDYTINGMTISFYIYKYTNEKDFYIRTSFQDARSPWLSISPNPKTHIIGY